MMEMEAMGLWFEMIVWDDGECCSVLMLMPRSREMLILMVMLVVRGAVVMILELQLLLAKGALPVQRGHRRWASASSPFLSGTGGFTH